MAFVAGSAYQLADDPTFPVAEIDLPPVVARSLAGDLVVLARRNLSQHGKAGAGAFADVDDLRGVELCVTCGGGGSDSCVAGFGGRSSGADAGQGDGHGLWGCQGRALGVDDLGFNIQIGL